MSPPRRAYRAPGTPQPRRANRPTLPARPEGTRAAKVAPGDAPPPDGTPAAPRKPCRMLPHHPRKPRRAAAATPGMRHHFDGTHAGPQHRRRSSRIHPHGTRAAPRRPRRGRRTTPPNPTPRRRSTPEMSQPPMEPAPRHRTTPQMPHHGTESAPCRRSHGRSRPPRMPHRPTEPRRRSHADDAATHEARAASQGSGHPMELAPRGGGCGGAGVRGFLRWRAGPAPMPGGKRSAGGVLPGGEVCPREHSERHHAGSGKIEKVPLVFVAVGRALPAGQGRCGRKKTRPEAGRSRLIFGLPAWGADCGKGVSRGCAGRSSVRCRCPR
ncbi:hypothetical protein J2S42_004600 [Catenuloplanes indicus]|uniref:Uncharacterized protein n=1 Tax=Catenuloplanes indicus TaxID=137267 RepID=A0AAE3W235_9ACTN|nr:hypothetical protein [Catenuloplanes indicus]